MAHSNTILKQMLNLIPRHQFDSIVKSRDGNRYVKRFNCWNQLGRCQSLEILNLRNLSKSFSIKDFFFALLQRLICCSRFSASSLLSNSSL